MYLSRVELDLTRPATMVALSAPQKLHGAVESSFPGERRRRLWRLDRLGERLYLLILSEDIPDLSGVAEQFGTGAEPETRNYDPLLQRITAGSCWNFRLTANPTKSCKGNDPEVRGTVEAHCSVKFQKKWLMERAEKHGFALDEDGFTVTNIKWQHFHKKHYIRPVTLLAVTYEGVLRVTDPEAFRQTLCNGMGRGKAYGLGMMTVIRGGNGNA